MKKQTLLPYLPLAIILGSFLITWGVFTTRISANEEKIVTQQNKMESVEEKIQDMQIRIERIDVNVGFIKDKLE